MLGLALPADAGPVSEIGFAAQLGAMAEASKAALASDLACYLCWCQDTRIASLAAQPENLVRYITMLEARGAKPATVARRVASLAAAHGLSGLQERGHAPHSHVMVRAALKGLRRRRISVAAGFVCTIVGFPDNRKLNTTIFKMSVDAVCRDVDHAVVKPMDVESSAANDQSPALLGSVIQSAVGPALVRTRPDRQASARIIGASELVGRELWNGHEQSSILCRGGGLDKCGVLMRDVAVEGACRVKHVRTHAAAGFLAVAFGDRAHHRVVLRA